MGDHVATPFKLTLFVSCLCSWHFDELKVASLGLDVKTRKMNHGEGSRVIP